MHRECPDSDSDPTDGISSGDNKIHIKLEHAHELDEEEEEHEEEEDMKGSKSKIFEEPKVSVDSPCRAMASSPTSSGMGRRRRTGRALGVSSPQTSSPLVQPIRRHSTASKGSLLPFPTRFAPIKFEHEYDCPESDVPSCAATTPIPIKMERHNETDWSIDSLRATSLPSERECGVSFPPSIYEGYPSSFPNYFNHRGLCFFPSSCQPNLPLSSLETPPTIYEYHPVDPLPLNPDTPFENLVPIEPLEFDFGTSVKKHCTLFMLIDYCRTAKITAGHRGHSLASRFCHKAFCHRNQRNP